MPHSQSISPSRTLVVADDLTGACDAGIAFAQRGLKTRVLLQDGEVEQDTAPVCAVSTASRDCAPGEAVARLARLAARPAMGSFPCLFKKIDSVFRGNTAQEIAAAVRLFGAELSIVAPAYPALGRTSVGGAIHIDDLHGKRQIQALDALNAANLEAHLIPAGNGPEFIASELLESIRPPRKGVVYCDAIHQSDLEEIVAAANRLRVRLLWIGSAGLAHALAASHIPRSVPSLHVRPGVVPMFIGSDHPVSGRQVEHLRSHGDVLYWPIGSPPPQGLAAARALVVPIECGRTLEQAIADLAQQIEPREVSCIFMTGGDTAALVCRALGVHRLELQTEFAPGIPQALAMGGRFDGSTMVLKSGGFGDLAVMSRIVDRFARRKEVCFE